MRVVILSTILVTVVALTVLFAYLVSKYIRERPQPPSMTEAYKAYTDEERRMALRQEQMQQIMRLSLDRQRKLEEEMFNKWKEDNQ